MKLMLAHADASLSTSERKGGRVAGSEGKREVGSAERKEYMYAMLMLISLSTFLIFILYTKISGPREPEVVSAASVLHPRACLSSSHIDILKLSISCIAA